MNTMTVAEHGMAELLIEALNFEDMKPADIEPEGMLFGEGLGLDSIDALEIALMISQKHGVELRAEDPATKDAFATLRSLTNFVLSHSKKAS